MKKNVLFITLLGTFAMMSCKKEVTVTPTTNDAISNNTVEDVQVTNNNFKDLPAKALETINSHYTDANIVSYEIKTIPIIGKSFEVKFNDGSEIDFDENGTWHEWKDAKGLPDGVLPANIKEYITKNYGSTFATSIDKEKDKISVELATDVDLEFDANGNFLRIDR